mgnify:FL=1
MANNGEINLIASQEAFRQVDELIAKITEADKKMLALANHALTVNKIISTINTPKGLNEFVENSRKITAELQKETIATEKLKQKLLELNIQRVKNSNLTAQQRVDKQIINTELKREAILTSQVAGEYRKLSAQVAIASEKYQNLLVRGRAAGQTQKEFNRELRQAQQEFRTLQNRVLSADKAVDKWSRTGERSIGFAKNLLSAFGVVGGVTAVATFTQAVFNEIKEIQSLDLALKNVTETQENFYSQQVFLNRVAADYGLKINDLTKQYTQFYVNAKGKLGNGEIQNIFESISKSTAVMGLSSENAESAFYALNQMMSKGTVQAEELRGQLGDALPGAFKAMVAAYQKLHPEMKVTEASFAKLMKDGKVLSAEVIPEFAKQLEIMFNVETVTRVETLTSKTNRLSSAWTDFVRNLDNSDTGGISRFFGFFIDLGTDVLNLLKDINGEVNKSQKNYDTKFAEGQKNIQRDLNEIKKSGLETEKELLETARLKRKYALEQFEGTTREMQWLTEKAKEYGSTMKYIAKNNTFYAYNKEYQENKKNLEDTNKKLNELAKTQGFYNGVVKGATDFINGLTETKKKDNQETEKTKAQLRAEEKERKALAKQLEEELRLRYELQQAKAERKLKLNEERLKEDNLYFSERLKIIQENSDLAMEIAMNEYFENIRRHKDSKMQMEIDAINYANKIEEIERKKTDDSINELDRYYKEFENYHKKYDGEGLKLDLFGEDPKKTFEDWQNNAKKATDETEKLKKATEDWIASFKDDFIQNSGFVTFFDLLQNKIQGFGTDFKATFLAVTEVAQEFFNFFQQLNADNFENERQALEQQRDISIAYAGDSAEAKAEIERQFQREQREIRKREAKAQKQMALFNIAINTAQGIISALASTPPNVPLSIAIGVTGALQAAFVAGKEIPQYWKGTDYHKGGLMLVNDGKGMDYRETIVTPDGTITQPEGRNVLMNKPIGTKVFTNAQWKAELDKMLFGNNISYAVQSNGLTKEDLYTHGNNIVNAINNNKNYRWSFDKNGIKEYVSYGSVEIENMNNRAEGIGKIL